MSLMDSGEHEEPMSDTFLMARRRCLEVPLTLIEDVEDFKTVMLGVDRGLKDRRLAETSAQEQVSSACDALARSLREHIQREPYVECAIGKYVFRESFPYLSRSRFVDRAYAKPRGYAGDFATIDMLYQECAEGDGRIGPLIDRWVRQLPAARAVKNRRALLGDAITRLARAWVGHGPMPITSLASGPAREVFDVLTGPDPADVLATCVDIDELAVAFASDMAKQLGVADRVVCARDNVVRMIQGRGHVRLRPQALIYSVGLTDYLPDSVVHQLINWGYENLLPGGTFIIGNVVPSNPDKAYMDHVLEWPLIHRSAAQLRNLFAQSRFGADSLSLVSEPAGVDLFAFCCKSFDGDGLPAMLYKAA
jgi:hypothetical protein